MFSVARVATVSICGAARFNAVAAAVPAKMQTLHKILIGEVIFKNKALVKESNVEQVFGAEWKKELEAYASKLPADQKKVLDRQVARLSLTRYTTRELAQFATKGPENVDAAANAFMVCLLYTSDAADDLLCVDLDGRLNIEIKRIPDNNTLTD
eukprot:TRINITY_DN22172_c0_g1_i1.p1 TRINITY_DN22172_c0_g1~~TRINITY_DN22172_c0_g1_i1.p1  ORF type:complete len:154 (+),score=65.39 TRINITY_DN22172_c0_g1_i1:89-550(+)